jgi:hypothetical protein
MATAMSYTGRRRSLNKYLPISVRAAAESIASRPTRLRSRYGVASRPYNIFYSVYVIIWRVEIYIRFPGNPCRTIQNNCKKTLIYIAVVANKELIWYYTLIPPVLVLFQLLYNWLSRGAQDAIHSPLSTNQKLKLEIKAKWAFACRLFKPSFWLIKPRSLQVNAP